MSGSKKIKKKAIKEQNIDDAVFKDAVDDFDRFEDFFSTNLKKILIASIVIVVVLIAGYMIYTQIEEAKNKASVALTSAKTIEELNNAIKKYPDSITDDAAKLNLATLYFNDEKFQKALDAYQALAISAQPGNVRNRARLNEAYTLEVMKKTEESADKFAMIALDVNLPEYIRNEANYSAARIFVSINKPERAKGCLKSIKLDNLRDFWASQAKRLLQRVDAKDIVVATSTPVVITASPEGVKPTQKAVK